MSTAFDSFVTVHQYQLASIPKELWQTLFMKLGEDYLDAGEYFELHYGDPLAAYSLHLKADKTLEKHGNIFLIDHAWTTSPETAKKELSQNPALLERLESLMDIEKPELVLEEEEVKPTNELIKLVALQANVSEKDAEEALVAEDNEVVNAIMRLTLNEDFKKESNRLQNQVMGQVIASGKAEAKEKEEEKEKAEKRQKLEQEWIEGRAGEVYEKMWSFIQTYSYSILQQDGQPTTQTAWYVNDEVGSALNHSNTPNVACMPFIFSRGASGMIPYSVFFPIQDLSAGEIATCDLLPKTIERESDKTAYLLAFDDRVLLSEGGKESLTECYEAHKNATPASLDMNKVLDRQQAIDCLKAQKKEKKDSIVVYTDTPFVQQFLKLDNVKFTTELERADIIWLSNDFSDFASLKSHQTVNQIPNENCLTYKQNFAQLVKKTFGSPFWFMPTYNLMTELSEFAGDYLHTEDEAETNIWITKPWNAARGIGLNITRNLSEIIRCHDDTTPRIAQRYLTSPCLYNGKKFDLRYIVLVRKVEPHLIVSVYNMFWIRLANKKFNLEDLSDYERQFTVMNYSTYQMTQLDYKSFIQNMEKQYPIQWQNVQQDINAVIKDALSAAVSQAQPLGFAGGEKIEGDTFAMYGFDIMLTDDFKPVILEINFAPDCTRACQYDPQFVNNIFSVVDDRFGKVEQGLEAFTVL
ncbi:Tubulin--tyrosine ligase-like protein 12 [Rhizopus stolonifer]|uniref:Tubulin--tyrosine ligase-like protein 12 n=1 Tax=Rhizopus stolonifer TaxID=4846 RepID=A0A367KQC4_RHIST|nr:Tubulin--tyrosine ligase-like protein 12 [Rhizopus stolonifer]